MVDVAPQKSLQTVAAAYLDPFDGGLLTIRFLLEIVVLCWERRLVSVLWWWFICECKLPIYTYMHVGSIGLVYLPRITEHFRYLKCRYENLYKLYINTAYVEKTHPKIASDRFQYLHLRYLKVLVIEVWVDFFVVFDVGKYTQLLWIRLLQFQPSISGLLASVKVV